MSTLRQAKLRVNWAREKVSDLKLTIQFACKDALDSVAEQTDPVPRSVYSQFRENLSDEAARIISEFALHARCALYYVIFALASRDSRAEQKRTQFPINKSPQYFAVNRTRCLKHLTDEHVAIV